jgi:hypothetical protein
MSEQNRNSHDDALDSLFLAYRDACDSVEPSAGFMPGLWEMIDRRRSFVFQFRRWANAFATVAAVASLAILALQTTQYDVNLPTRTYIEVLDDDQADGLVLQDVALVDHRSDRGFTPTMPPPGR